MLDGEATDLICWHSEKGLEDEGCLTPTRIRPAWDTDTKMLRLERVICTSDNEAEIGKFENDPTTWESRSCMTRSSGDVTNRIMFGGTFFEGMLSMMLPTCTIQIPIPKIEADKHILYLDFSLEMYYPEEPIDEIVKEYVEDGLRIQLTQSAVDQLEKEKKEKELK